MPKAIDASVTLVDILFIAHGLGGAPAGVGKGPERFVVRLLNRRGIADRSVAGIQRSASEAVRSRARMSVKNCSRPVSLFYMPWAANITPRRDASWLRAIRDPRPIPIHPSAATLAKTVTGFIKVARRDTNTGPLTMGMKALS